jgi:hypothetical protein
MEVSDANGLKALEEENARLKRLLAETMLDASALRELLSKRVVGPAAKGAAVARLQAGLGLSEWWLCTLI